LEQCDRTTTTESGKQTNTGDDVTSQKCGETREAMLQLDVDVKLEAEELSIDGAVKI